MHAGERRGKARPVFKWKGESRTRRDSTTSRVSSSSSYVGIHTRLEEVTTPCTAQNKRSVTRGNGRHPNPGPLQLNAIHSAMIMLCMCFLSLPVAILPRNEHRRVNSFARIRLVAQSCDPSSQPEFSGHFRFARKPTHRLLEHARHEFSSNCFGKFSFFFFLFSHCRVACLFVTRVVIYIVIKVYMLL